MRRTFNLGLGMVIAVAPDAVAAAVAALAAYAPRPVGRLVARGTGAPSRFVGDH
jgi:phosphoribosylaminoimidazole (AIR) synthetase